MKVIITGGLGFIFSHVTEFFLENGYEVLVLDNQSAGSNPGLVAGWKAKYPKFHFNKLDVSFAPCIWAIQSFDPDYIIHAAAISDVDYSIKSPVVTIHANNNATLNVFQAAIKCKNLKKLLYVSTDEVYGECDHPKTEDEIIFPKNPYALSKAFGSLLRLAYDNSYPELKDKTCETRFCNVFGPRQDQRKVLSAIKSSLATGKPLPVHNDGSGYRQYIHVSEIPPLVEHILRNGTRTYNITSGAGYTVRELIGMAEELTGKKINTVPAKRQGMDMRYDMSSARLREELDWRPSRTFKEALTEYLKS